MLIIGLYNLSTEADIYKILDVPKLDNGRLYMPVSYATILQQLCREHMTHKISFVDYRRRRKMLLAKIDEQFNGAPQVSESNLTAPGIPQDEFGINRFLSNPNK